MGTQRTLRLVERAVLSLEKKKLPISVQLVIAECNVLGYSARPSAPTVRARLRDLGFQVIPGPRFEIVKWERRPV